MRRSEIRISIMAFLLLALILIVTLASHADTDDRDVVRARVTAYAPMDDKSGICGGPVTSRGFRPNRHYAAVDPSRIPYGTRMYVPGYGEVVAADTGGALRSYDGYAVDLYFDTHEEAVAWGKRSIRIIILGPDYPAKIMRY